MSTYEQALDRNKVLFVGSYLESQKQALVKMSQILGRNIQAIVIYDVTDIKAKDTIASDGTAVVMACDFSSSLALQKALLPYRDNLLVVTVRAEKNVPLLKKVIPHVPYLSTPTELSLDWTTDKIRMRQLLRGYDKSISPKFLVAHDSEPETLNRIERVVGFPLIIKPSGLAASLLVSLCYHQEELDDYLKKTVRKINQIYKKKKGRGEPQILVEEFMDGVMYSIDAYVNQRGTIYHTPLVHVKTGRSVGFEDFFGYMRITPVQLKPYKIEAAHKAANKAIEALGLRSTTCHIELMKTEDGWKVIELGPRMGGFRDEMYKLAYGFDHSLNDILIRVPKKPIITKKAKGSCAVLQFYSKEKGRFEALQGVSKVRQLESFSRIELKKKLGDMCDFARNGDDPVLTVVLFNKKRSNLLADIRRMEKAIVIKVKKPTRTKAQV